MGWGEFLAMDRGEALLIGGIGDLSPDDRGLAVHPSEVRGTTERWRWPHMLAPMPFLSDRPTFAAAALTGTAHHSLLASSLAS